MNWDLVLGILAALATLVATSSAALSWAAQNGERLGRLIARRIPGDDVERFLIEFLGGVRQGLKEGISVEAKAQGSVTEVRVRVPAGNARVDALRTRR